MSAQMPVGPAMTQLREVLSILRELSNAGPRDPSFKQWRQVTVTLLQRIWPGDQSRAARFRRIPFSTPSLRADAIATREAFERGCLEAITYLESLAHELEASAGLPGANLVRPPEAPVRPIEEGPRSAEPPLEASLPPVEPSEPAKTAAASLPVPRTTRKAPASPVAPEATSPPAPVKSDRGRAGGRSRQRLKDMLGFGDEATASPAPARPAAAAVTAVPATPAPPPPTAAQSPARATQEVPAPAAPRSPGHAVPASPLPSTPPFPLGSFAVRAAVPPPAGDPGPPQSSSEDDAEFDEESFDLGFDPGEGPLQEVAPAPATSLSATLREMIDREPALRPAPSSRAAREVLMMAAMMDKLGVPPERRTIVRAALIDLGRQMEAPPVHWAAIRQVMAFIMDYPQIARRVMPLLMPYLDEAA